MFKQRSPLDECVAAGGRASAAGATAVRFGVLHGWRLVQVNAFERSAERFDAAVSGLIGGSLPLSPSVVAQSGAHRLYRIGADQHWIATRDGSLPEALALAVPADLGSVIDLSHARVRIALDGSAVNALLGKVVSVDLRLRAFPVGQFVQTGLHHTGVLLERLGPEHYEIYALRTYAQSIWEWLTDAALPYGYDVTGDNDKEPSP
jgi:methylglutamate dehydrogenase subunit D